MNAQASTGSKDDAYAPSKRRSKRYVLLRIAGAGPRAACRELSGHSEVADRNIVAPPNARWNDLFKSRLRWL